MKIRNANKGDIQSVKDIAVVAWEYTYKKILSPEQFDYMIEMMYSDQSLMKQFEDNQQFAIIYDGTNNIDVGFVSFEYNYKNSSKTKIHKLYVLPKYHKHGLGQDLIDYVISKAKKENNSHISLNMNRNNSSFGFYKKMGFEIVKEEDINIGNGYLMEDYIFEKTI